MASSSLFAAIAAKAASRRYDLAFVLLKSRSFLASRSFFWIEACCAFSFAAASSKAWSCFWSNEKRPRVVGGRSGTASGNFWGAGAGAARTGAGAGATATGAATGGATIGVVGAARVARAPPRSRATDWRGGGDGGSASRRVDATGLSSSTKKRRRRRYPVLGAQCSHYHS